MYRRTPKFENKYKSLRLKEFNLSRCNFDLPASPNSNPIMVPSATTPSEKREETLPHPNKTIYKFDYDYAYTL
jgi:hypothetical protein